MTKMDSKPLIFINKYQNLSDRNVKNVRKTVESVRSYQNKIYQKLSRFGQIYQTLSKVIKRHQNNVCCK